MVALECALSDVEPSGFELMMSITIAAVISDVTRD